MTFGNLLQVQLNVRLSSTNNISESNGKFSSFFRQSLRNLHIITPFNLPPEDNFGDTPPSPLQFLGALTRSDELQTSHVTLRFPDDNICFNCRNVGL